MRTIRIHRGETHFADPMIMAYLGGDELHEFYHLPPSRDSLRKAVERRRDFEDGKRKVLVAALRQQYERAGIESETGVLGKQLTDLSASGAYTVTTGQQLHVGLGPLYVLYKIVDVLRLAREVEDATGERIVPIFWMASEDHDLEEVRSMRVFGKEFVWDTDQQGPVGRMHTEGLTQLIQDVRAQFRWDPAHSEFLDLLEEGYSLSNYADATRFILHKLFGDHGLVILDADDPTLKAEFKDVMRSELRGEHIPFFSKSSEALKAQGYPLQIHIHSCNLFHLSQGQRIKLENQADRDHKGEYIPAAEASAWMDREYADCSPNVALRPLYQEWILPNLMYIGGNAELKYWLQLGAIFNNYSHPMPILWPRSSYVVVPNTVSNTLKDNDLHMYYLDLAEFSELVEQDLSNQRKELHDKLDGVQAALTQFSQDFSAVVKGMSVEGKVAKLSAKVAEIQDFTDKSIGDMMRNDPRLKKALKLRDRYFNAGAPQERNEHWISFPDLAETLMCQENWNTIDNLLNINHLLLD